MEARLENNPSALAIFSHVTRHTGPLAMGPMKFSVAHYNLLQVCSFWNLLHIIAQKLSIYFSNHVTWINSVCLLLLLIIIFSFWVNYFIKLIRMIWFCFFYLQIVQFNHAPLTLSFFARSNTSTGTGFH